MSTHSDRYAPAVESSSAPGFFWDRLHVEAHGPAVEETSPGEASDAAVFRADGTLSIHRPIEGAEEFCELVFTERFDDGSDGIVQGLLEDFPSHSLRTQAAAGDWTVTVRGAVGAWEALARAANNGEVSRRLASTGPVRILQNAMNYDVAGPNCALALAAVGGPPERDRALAAYCSQTGAAPDEGPAAPGGRTDSEGYSVERLDAEDLDLLVGLLRECVDNAGVGEDQRAERARKLIQMLKQQTAQSSPPE